MDALSQLRIFLKNNDMNPDEYDEDYLNMLIETAQNDYITARRFPTSYTDEQIQEELTKNQFHIVKRACKVGSQTGSPFATAVTENGVSRTFENVNELPQGVLPFPKIS